MLRWERHCHEPNALIGHVGFYRGLSRVTGSSTHSFIAHKWTTHALRLTKGVCMTPFFNKDDKISANCS